jgi:mRNA-degrading endonuclease toxin of MazEF toxin-antitoxin module
MPRRPPRFGDVWNIKGGVMGPEPWLIVSSDLYLELGEDNMLAVPIREMSRPGSRVVTEPIPDVGQAVLDRISALPRTWIVGDDPVTELHSARRADVGRRIRNLIGP